MGLRRSLSLLVKRSEEVARGTEGNEASSTYTDARSGPHRSLSQRLPRSLRRISTSTTPASTSTINIAPTSVAGEAQPSSPRTPIKQACPSFTRTTVKTSDLSVTVAAGPSPCQTPPGLSSHTRTTPTSSKFSFARLANSIRSHTRFRRPHSTANRSQDLGITRAAGPIPAQPTTDLFTHITSTDNFASGAIVASQTTAKSPTFPPSSHLSLLQSVSALEANSEQRQGPKMSSTSPPKSLTHTPISHYGESPFSDFPQGLPLPLDGEKIMRLIFGHKRAKIQPCLEDVNAFWLTDNYAIAIMSEFLGPAYTDPNKYWLKTDEPEPGETVARDAAADVFMKKDNLSRSYIFDHLPARLWLGHDIETIRRQALEVTFVSDFDKFALTHAIRALDCMYDAELTRRRELLMVLDRLGITEENFEVVAHDSEACRKFMERLCETEVMIVHYTAIANMLLRLHVMLKHLENPNLDLCETIALLNTLFPPALRSEDLQAPHITTVQDYFELRGTIFRSFATIVANCDRSGLEKLIQDISMSNGHSWSTARDALTTVMNNTLKFVSNINDFQNWGQMVERMMPQDTSSIPATPRSHYEPRYRSTATQNAPFHADDAVFAKNKAGEAAGSQFSSSRNWIESGSPGVLHPATTHGSQGNHSGFGNQSGAAQSIFKMSPPPPPEVGTLRNPLNRNRSIVASKVSFVGRLSTMSSASAGRASRMPDNQAQRSSITSMESSNLFSPNIGQARGHVHVRRQSSSSQVYDSSGNLIKPALRNSVPNRPISSASSKSVTFAATPFKREDSNSTCSFDDCDHFCTGRMGKIRKGSCSNKCGHDCGETFDVGLIGRPDSRGSDNLAGDKSESIDVSESIVFRTPSISSSETQPRTSLKLSKFEADGTKKVSRLKRLLTRSTTSLRQKASPSDLGSSLPPGSPSVHSRGNQEEKLPSFRVLRGRKLEPTVEEVSERRYISFVESGAPLVPGLNPHGFNSVNATQRLAQGPEANVLGGGPHGQSGYEESFLIQHFPPDRPEQELDNAEYDLLRGGYAPQDSHDFARNEARRAAAIGKALNVRHGQNSRRANVQSEAPRPKEPPSVLAKMLNSFGDGYSAYVP